MDIGVLAQLVTAVVAASFGLFKAIVGVVNFFKK